MISGNIIPPHFQITNEKIILRHILAASLGFFFRENPEIYRDVDSLVFKGGITRYLDFIKSKPKELGKYIDERILDKVTVTIFGDYKWLNKVSNEDVQ